MKWKVPPRIKVYEALGAIADNRIAIKGNTATVQSSSGNKEYRVVFDAELHAIASNDNGSYWQGYLGYPAIAFLIKKEILVCDKNVANLLKGIAWKDINTRFKNDFEKTEEYLKGEFGQESWGKVGELAGSVVAQLKKLALEKLPSKTRPPSGY